MKMRVRPLFVTAVTVVLGLLGGAGVSSVSPDRFDSESTVSATQPATRVQPPRRVVIVSDSAMAGVRWNGALNGLRGFDFDHRLESCRRLVETSCRGRERRRPPTALVEVSALDTPLANDVLVIAVGYNDLDNKFAGHARLVLDAAVAKGFQTIAWVTYRENVTFELPGLTVLATSIYRNMNAELRRLVASGAYPALQLWDLHAYTVNAAAWFHDDGVHQRVYGSWAVADWLSRQMAALDGRPCPLPWTPNYPPDDVCVDPNTLVSARGHPSIGLLYDF